MKNNKAAGPDDVAIGASIRRIRKMREMSQSALADALGVSFQQVQKYEKGASRMSVSRLVEVAKALNCQIKDFITETHEIAPAPEPRHSRDAQRMAVAFDAITDARQKRKLLALAIAMAASGSGEAIRSDDD